MAWVAALFRPCKIRRLVQHLQTFLRPCRILCASVPPCCSHTLRRSTGADVGSSSGSSSVAAGGAAPAPPTTPTTTTTQTVRAPRELLSQPQDVAMNELDISSYEFGFFVVFTFTGVHLWLVINEFGIYFEGCSYIYLKLPPAC